MAKINKDISPRLLRNQNFERYFIELLEQITVEQKARIPVELRPLLLGDISKVLKALDFETILYLMHLVFGKPLNLVIGDENGINVASFLKLYDAVRKGESIEKVADDMSATMLFTLGGYDISAMLSYLNFVSISPVYRRVLHYKSQLRRKKNRVLEEREEMEKNFEGITRLLSLYEQNRLRYSDYGLNETEWFILLLIGYKEMDAAVIRTRLNLKGKKVQQRTVVEIMHRLMQMGWVGDRGETDRIYYLTAEGRTILKRVVDIVVTEF